MCAQRWFILPPLRLSQPCFDAGRGRGGGRGGGVIVMGRPIMYGGCYFEADGWEEGSACLACPPLLLLYI